MSPADLDLLLSLRLVVARVGETDNAAWWASDGVLSPTGQFTYARLAPRTAPFARARVVFAVARARCAPHVPAGAVSLWALPPDVEEAFDDRWALWLDGVEAWTDTFEAVERVEADDVLAALQGQGLIQDGHATDARALAAAPPDRSVELPPARTLDADALRRLAAAFACGRPAALVVPYLRLSA